MCLDACKCFLAHFKHIKVVFYLLVNCPIYVGPLHPQLISWSFVAIPSSCRVRKNMDLGPPCDRLENSLHWILRSELKLSFTGFVTFAIGYPSVKSDIYWWRVTLSTAKLKNNQFHVDLLLLPTSRTRYILITYILFINLLLHGVCGINYIRLYRGGKQS